MQDYLFFPTTFIPRHSCTNAYIWDSLCTKAYLQWALKVWAAHQNFALFRIQKSADIDDILSRCVRKRIYYV
jgi:hypothetical protein